MSKNHANVNGDKNPFYGKKHSEELKKQHGLLFIKTWELKIPNNEPLIIEGKKQVKYYVDNYNSINNTKVSFHSLCQYGKNGDNWELKLFKRENNTIL